MEDLETYRFNNGLSQEDIEVLTGVSQSRISIIEAGGNPTTNEKKLIESGLGVKIDWILTSKIKQKKVSKKERIMQTNQRQADGTGVPDMPEMKFNSDGSPDFSHLDNNEKKETTIRRRKKDGVPPMPEMRFNEDGSPNFDHLNDED